MLFFLSNRLEMKREKKKTTHTFKTKQEKSVRSEDFLTSNKIKRTQKKKEKRFAFIILPKQEEQQQQQIT
jgi:hypothetical protein